MDPTVPQGNKPNNPAEPNPIQTGQFVVTQGVETVNPQEPLSPQQPIAAAQNSPSFTPQPAPFSSIATSSPTNPIMPSPAPPVAPSQFPVNNPPPSAANTPPPPSAPQFLDGQPNPTPFISPNSPMPSPQGGSGGGGIHKLRTIVMVVIALVLIGALAGGGWFFYNRMKSSKEQDKTASGETPIEAPSPTPPRTSGGFSELPPATGEAIQSTPSAQ